MPLSRNRFRARIGAAAHLAKPGRNAMLPPVAGVAQPVEHQLPKLKSPAIKSIS